MFLAISMVRRGVITSSQLVDAIERQLDSRPQLGRMALAAGKLTMKQVFAVLKEQATRSEPFGEIAVELGFMTKRQVSYLLRKQWGMTASISECLIEVGAIDSETLQRERRRCRSTLLGDPESGSSRQSSDSAVECGRVETANCC